MCSAAEVLPVLWGRQSCLQPPFQTALLDMRESSIPAAPAESRRQPGLAAPQSSAYSLFCLPQTSSVSSRGLYNHGCGIVFALLNPSPHILRAPGEGVPNRPKGSAGSDQQQVETCNLGGFPTQEANHAGGRA